MFYVVPDVYLFIYLFRHRISELRRPIAVKLYQVITIWVRFIMQVEKFVGPPLNLLNLAQFYTTSDFDREYLRNCSRYPKLENQLIETDFSRIWRNKSGELWSTIHNVWHASLDPPKLTFSGDYISAPRECWLLKFLHALDIHQALLAHTTNRVGVPQKILRANI